MSRARPADNPILESAPIHFAGVHDVNASRSLPRARDSQRLTGRGRAAPGATIAPRRKRLGGFGNPPCARGGLRAWAAGLTAAVSLATLALLAPPARAEDGNTVRANMLWNIAKFIRWPETAFVAGESDFVFTILGDDSLAETLAANLSTKMLNGRPVFVRVVGRAQDVVGSQIVYVASSAMSRVPDVLRELRGGPALTVANTPGFVAGGGMVGFIAEDGNVRFEIHQARAEKAGLKISAKLLAIAHVVVTEPAANR